MLKNFVSFYLNQKSFSHISMNIYKKSKKYAQKDETCTSYVFFLIQLRSNWKLIKFAKIYVKNTQKAVYIEWLFKLGQNFSRGAKVFFQGFFSFFDHFSLKINKFLSKKLIFTQLLGEKHPKVGWNYITFAGQSVFFYSQKLVNVNRIIKVEK